MRDATCCYYGLAAITLWSVEHLPMSKPMTSASRSSDRRIWPRLHSMTNNRGASIASMGVYMANAIWDDQGAFCRLVAALRVRIEDSAMWPR